MVSQPKVEKVVSRDGAMRRERNEEEVINDLWEGFLIS